MVMLVSDSCLVGHVHGFIFSRSIAGKGFKDNNWYKLLVTAVKALPILYKH